MSDQNTPQPDEDVEGHRIKFKIDTEAATEDDAEGHVIRPKGMDTQAVTEDDAEGHGARWGGFDAEAVTEDDTEGHGLRPFDKQLDSDDVEGHVNFINPDGPQDQG